MTDVADGYITNGQDDTVNTNFETITREAELLSLPDIYLKLRNVLDSPDFAMAEVAVVISQDPAITLRLLHLVNSSFYGFTNKIETVGRAINLLGTEQIHDLVLATAVASAFKGISTTVMDMRKFWERSLYCAAFSRRLAVLSGKRDRERLFVAGLLCDIGHLIMYQAIPEPAQQAILQSKERQEPVYLAERRIIGFDYAFVGGILMRHWALPDVLRETTMFHIDPAAADNFTVEASLVHIGSMMTQALEEDCVFNEGPLHVDGSVWALAGLEPEDCSAIHDEVQDDVRQAMDVVFSPEIAY